MRRLLSRERPQPDFTSSSLLSALEKAKDNEAEALLMEGIRIHVRDDGLCFYVTEWRSHKVYSVNSRKAWQWMVFPTRAMYGYSSDDVFFESM